MRYQEDATPTGFLHHDLPNPCFGGFGTVTIAINWTDEQDSVRSYTDHALAGFEIHATYQPYQTTPTLYGFRAQYSDHMILQLDDLERMVKHLRKVHRRLDRYTAEWGEASDFGSYAIRVLKACNVKHVIHPDPTGPGKYSRPWTTYEIQDLASVIPFTLRKDWKRHLERETVPA